MKRCVLWKLRMRKRYIKTTPFSVSIKKSGLYQLSRCCSATSPTLNRLSLPEMSANDQAAAALLSQIALAADGAFLGLTLAYVAVRSFVRLSSTSSALRQIGQSPSCRVSDLRSLLSADRDDESEHSTSSDGLLVVVRGVVDAKSVTDCNWKSSRPNLLVSHETGEEGVILQRMQRCIYSEWKGLFTWSSGIRSLFSRSWKEQESTSLRTVPFVLVEGGLWPQSDDLIVNMDGSRHPLPLTTVYHQLLPVNACPYTYLQALFGHDYPVGILDEEKILPLGKEITAVGICSLKNGIPEIKSCKNLPYFLSEMTKDQMVTDLAFRSKVLFWSVVILGSVSIGVLGYAVVRNWNRYNEWKQQRRVRQSEAATAADSPIPEEDETGEVPNGELCVICLTNRKRSAFIPCGHLVCCQRCARTVENETSPKCPVCRQTVRRSVRIYNS